MKDQVLAERKALIAANKQSLQLLNQQLKLLQGLETGNDYWGAGRFPYFYSMVDNADQPGVAVFDNNVGVAPVGAETTNTVFQGKIRVQSDAPFVATHIMTTLKRDGDFTGSLAGLSEVDAVSFGGIQHTSPFAMPDVSLGFIEEGSGRILFQAERFDLATVGNANNRDELMSPEFFNSTRLFGATAPYGDAPGHGPNAPFELISECLLPKNDVITVKLRPSFYNQNTATFGAITWRFYVSLLGYKIFGD